MERLIICGGVRDNKVRMRDIKQLLHVLEYRILDHRIKMEAKEGDLQKTRC